MRFAKYLILLAFLVMPICSVFAAPVSALELCAFSDGQEFLLSTTDSDEAEQLGFQQFNDSDIFLRKFRVLVDGMENSAVKPVEKKNNCIRINKIPAGKHTVSLDLKHGSYTLLEVAAPYVTTFKANLLHNGKINLAKGAVATVEIHQLGRKIELYQAVTDQAVPNCEYSCEVPVGVPLYFVEKKDNVDKALCKPEFQLVLENERDKNLGCYDKVAIEKMLEKYVADNNIQCNPEVEIAFFRVFGEGCVVTPAADPEGIGILPPQIRMIPLSKKNNAKYFIARYPKEKTPYNFSGERGEDIIPEKGEIIEFFEEKE